MALRRGAGRRWFGRRAEPEEPPAPPDPLELVRAYHQLTKHDFASYARGPGYLDWESQPAPFRHWEGASRVGLPQPAEEAGPDWEEVLV